MNRIGLLAATIGLVTAFSPGPTRRVLQRSGLMPSAQVQAEKLAAAEAKRARRAARNAAGAAKAAQTVVDKAAARK